MVFLILAIACSTVISIIMRISTDKTSANLSMLAVNYMVCSVLGATFAGFDLWMPQAPGCALTVGLGVLNGMLYLSGFVILQQSVRKNGIVLSSVFMKLGLLVPLVMSVLFFGEVPTPVQIVGFVMAVCAIVIINLKKETGAKGFGIGLILLLLVNGGGDAMSKVFEVLGPANLSEQFLCYTFLTAFLLCSAMVLWKKERPGVWELAFGFLIGIPNFFSAKFLLLSLTKLPAVVVYPSFSVGTLLLVTLTGVAVFREWLSKVQWLAMAAIIAALVLLNI